MLELPELLLELLLELPELLLLARNILELLLQESEPPRVFLGEDPLDLLLEHLEFLRELLRLLGRSERRGARLLGRARNLAESSGAKKSLSLNSCGVGHWLLGSKLESLIRFARDILEHLLVSPETSSNNCSFRLRHPREIASFAWGILK